jgi:hypothetical protein
MEHAHHPGVTATEWTPPPDVLLIASRTWCIPNPSVGIQVRLRKSRKAGPYRSRGGLATPGGIFPEWLARSSGNGG